MGSLVISEVLHDATRARWPTMVASNIHKDLRQSDGDTHVPMIARSESSHLSQCTPTTSSQRTPLNTQHPTPILVTSPTPAAASPDTNSRIVPRTVAQPSALSYTGLRPPSTGPGPRPPRSPRLIPSQNEPTPSRVPQVDSTSISTSTGPPSSPPSSRSATPHTECAIHSPARIKVRDLQHIQSFVSDDISSVGSAHALSYRPQDSAHLAGPRYEISTMPVSDIIEMVAGLLTKITTTNDRQHEHLHRQIPPPQGVSSLSLQTSSVMAFHGKNVPAITILSYLGRIHKYCPTTYEVFLSLLVYFDRMTERVNSGPLQSLRQANQDSLDRLSPKSETGSDGSLETLVAETESHQSSASSTPAAEHASSPSSPPDVHRSEQTSPSEDLPSPSLPDCAVVDPYNLSQFFVVDSFNIHRLVIAGVTCASKFFSDVFYTNSRYAKVSVLASLLACLHFMTLYLF